MKKLIFSICFALAFFIQTISACSLSVKPLGKFDETEYIFIGEVTGFTQPVKSEKFSGEAYGLIVKVKESIYLPKQSKTHFEVFPIQLWADCSESGQSLEQLKKEFPINSEIRVIAKESELLANDLPDGNIRLEDRPGESGSIIVNYDETKSRLTSANSVFDYKSFNYDINKTSPSKYLLPNFEIRKDLFRLKISQTQKQRTDILNRLLEVPICCNDLDLYTVFKTYSANEAEFNQLRETRLRKDLTKQEFEHYKAVNETLSELIKLGYKKDEAEKAIENAQREGEEVSKQELLERSLRILRKDKIN